MGRQQGISLVEIMISLVTGLILIAGVIQIFSANKQTYRLADASARNQENARFAMGLLERDIRVAGYQGCAGSGRTLVNTLDTSSGSYNSFLHDFDFAIGGFEATSSSAWTPAVDSSITSPVAGSDILTMRAVLENGEDITGQPSNSADCSSAASHTAGLKVADASGYSAGSIVIAGNCDRAAIFQITAVNAGTNLFHNTGSGSPGNSTTDLGACFAGTGAITQITTRSFYIRNNSAGIPSLYRKDGSDAAEELVQGVEGMQILYGVDTDGDGSGNQLVRANDVIDWAVVVSVHISLVFRSEQDFLTTAPQSYVINGVTVTPTDQRLRRVFTSTIGLRNRLS